MIEIYFDKETAAERQETLSLHIDQQVTVLCGKVQVEGKLHQVSGKVARVQINDGTISNRVLTDISAVWVHVGGDWATVGGHSAGAMTDRIHVRCTPQEKRQLAAHAQAANISLSELMRQAGLQLLQRKPPARRSKA